MKLFHANNHPVWAHLARWGANIIASCRHWPSHRPNVAPVCSRG